MVFMENSFMKEKLRDRLRQQAMNNFVGREQELSKLTHLINNNEAIVVFVHGIGGIGKSSLLDILAEALQSSGNTVIKLDCRTIKPSEEGFLRELYAVIGGEYANLDDIATRLSQVGQRIILALDTYEVFRMMDTWLRQVFIPALSDNVQVIIFGREAPVSAWNTTAGWQGMFQSVRLGPLNNQDSEKLLYQFGIAETDIHRVVNFTAGHPLALKLAAAAIAERPDLTLKEVESQHVVTELTHLYLSDVRDPIARVVLEAASVVRRTTRSLLSAMLPDIAPDDAYDRLLALPFVDNASDGLLIHDLVQQAIANHLRAADPERYNNYRRAAWNRLRSEFAVGSRATIWRYTADMIYLIDHPAIHETFFPSDAHLYAVEPARSDDFEAIYDIALRRDGPELLTIIQHWRQKVPGAFYVARGRNGEVAGYYAMLQIYPHNNALQFDDPITLPWWQHLQSDPMPDGQLALFVLRWIARETGEDPSAVQGSLWLDIKRTYMEFPQTRRIYGILYDTQTWIPIFEQLGFVRLESNIILDDKVYGSVVNDFGPQLVPGWMAGLVDTQLGFDPPVFLDTDAHELVINNQRLGLTPLEFSLMSYLSEREGTVISRDELLSTVWGYDYNGGSNVVDAMVRSLRKKLGDYASCIETATGVGYRLRWPS